MNFDSFLLVTCQGLFCPVIVASLPYRCFFSNLSGGSNQLRLKYEINIVLGNEKDFLLSLLGIRNINLILLTNFVRKDALLELRSPKP